MYGTNEKLKQDGSLKPRRVDSCSNIDELNTLCMGLVGPYEKAYRPVAKIDR